VSDPCVDPLADEGLGNSAYLVELGDGRALDETNRPGPPLVGEDDPLSALPAAHVQRLLTEGALVVDVRPVVAFTAAHVPGSVSVPLQPVFVTRLGWLTEHDQPLVIVRDEDQDPGGSVEVEA
jgi:hydroxyacylglutathione hydrolase